MNRSLEEQARRLQAQGRRLGTALLLAFVAGAIAEVTLDSAETGAIHPGAPVTTVTRQATARAAPPKTTLPEAMTTTAPVTVKPEQAAAAWYAARHQLPLSRIKVLQVDRLSSTKVRVLLLVERAGGRLDSAIVTVTRTSSGPWRVTR